MSYDLCFVTSTWSICDGRVFHNLRQAINKNTTVQSKCILIAGSTWPNTALKIALYKWADSHSIPVIELDDNPHIDSPGILSQLSFRILNWIQQENPKSIHFLDSLGLIYYTLNASIMGIIDPGRISHSQVDSHDIHQWLMPEDSLIAQFFSSYQKNFQQIDTVGRNYPTQKPLISVCIAHHNRIKMLESCLRSLSEQTYTHFEVIVANNVSQVNKETATSLSHHFKNQFHFPVTFLDNFKNTPGAARNAAAKISRGQYLLFMDDDNMALPSELEQFINAINVTNTKIVTCPFIRFNNESEISNLSELPVWLPIGNVDRLGMRYNVYGDTNFLIERELFISTNGFTEEQVYGEDWELLSKLSLQKNPIFVIPQPLFYYRDHKDNLSHVLKLKSGLSHIVDNFKNQSLSYDTNFDPPLALAPIVFIDENPFTISQDIVQNARVWISENAIFFSPTNNDTQIHIPSFKKRNDNDISIQFSIKVTQACDFRVYWTTLTHQQYSEENSQVVRVSPNTHSYAMTISSREAIVNLRIDPTDNVLEFQMFNLFLF